MRSIKKLVLLLLAVMLVGNLFGCNFDDLIIDNGEEDKKVNTEMTQLYVSNFNGGFGKEWLSAAIKRFEEKYKDYELNGKIGVQVFPDNTKSMSGSSVITSGTKTINEIFFNENIYYYDLVSKDVALDISDIITELNTDNKTIKSKLTPEQDDYYGAVQQDGTRKYFMLPFYAAYFGLQYNRTLFDNHGLYFVGEPSNNYRAKKIDNNYTFFGDYMDVSSLVVSSGPDGVHGTADDGLPATYTEFFALCERMVGITPFVWNGIPKYWERFLNAMTADYEGLEQFMLNFTFDGYAENIVDSVDDSGNVVKKEPAVEIKASTGWELYGSAGRYYALSFMEKVVRNTQYYDSSKISTSYSHTDAQDDFVLSDYEGSGKPIAMMIEGNWWENEANDSGTFKRLESNNVKRADVNFNMMPLPKATDADIGKKSSVVDELYSGCFIKSTIAPEKIEIAKEFVKFCYTDESLQEYTVITNCLRACNYTLTDEQKAKLSPYGRNQYELILEDKSVEMIYPYAQSKLYIGAQSSLNMMNTFLTETSNNVYTTIKGGTSAKTHFEGIRSKYSSTAWRRSYELFF